MKPGIENQTADGDIYAEPVILYSNIDKGLGAVTATSSSISDTVRFVANE